MQNTAQQSHYPPGNHHANHSKNVLSPGPTHLLTTGTDDPILYHPSASEGDN